MATAIVDLFAFRAAHGRVDDLGAERAGPWLWEDDLVLFRRELEGAEDAGVLVGDGDAAASRAIDGLEVAAGLGEFWDEGASYLGAIDPVLKQDWTRDWTAYPEN